MSHHVKSRRAADAAGQAVGSGQWARRGCEGAAPGHQATGSQPPQPGSRGSACPQPRLRIWRGRLPSQVLLSRTEEGTAPPGTLGSFPWACHMSGTEGAIGTSDPLTPFPGQGLRGPLGRHGDLWGGAGVGQPQKGLRASPLGGPESGRCPTFPWCWPGRGRRNRTPQGLWPGQ